MKKIFILLALSGIAQQEQIFAQDELGERSPIIREFGGKINEQDFTLFISANYAGSTTGYLKIGNEVDSLRYGAYDADGTVSLNLKSGKEIEGKHELDTKLKLKLIDGKSKTKFEALARSNSNPIDGEYYIKDAKRFSNHSGAACYLMDDDHLYVNCFWEDLSLDHKKDVVFADFEGVAKRDYDRGSDEFELYVLTISHDDEHPSLNATAYIQRDTDSGNLVIFIESEMESVLGPLKNKERIWFKKG